MYRRAHLSRIMTLVVAPLLTAVSTSASAREFRGADTQIEAYPTVQALRFREAAMAGIYGKARDPAIAQLIARIRKVE